VWLKKGMLGETLEAAAGAWQVTDDAGGLQKAGAVDLAARPCMAHLLIESEQTLQRGTLQQAVARTPVTGLARRSFDSKRLGIAH